MIIWLLGLVCLGWCLIYPLTDFFARFLDPATIRQKAGGGKRLFLTFDDGPDPDYTPLILEILASHRVPAVFFLVGGKAERYPQLVTAILNNGHEIGLHTQEHRHAYLMFFKQSRASIRRGLETLQRLSGRPLLWFRPPWGAVNLFQYLAARHAKLRIVLWSANARDWKLQTGVPGIIGRLRRKTTNGGVVVLHDSGGEPGAPRNTIRALPEFIAECKAQGYYFGQLHDTGGSNNAWRHDATAD